MNLTVASVAVFAIAILTLFRAKEDRQYQLYSTVWWGVSFVLLAVAATIYANFWINGDWSYFFKGAVVLFFSWLVRDAGLRRRRDELLRDSE